MVLSAATIAAAVSSQLLSMPSIITGLCAMNDIPLKNLLHLIRSWIEMPVLSTKQPNMPVFLKSWFFGFAFASQPFRHGLL